MKILAADTSTASGSVALLQDDQLLAEWTLHSAKTHNRRLLLVVRSILKEAGWSIKDVDGFAVTTGPGSFTGLRIGLTTVKTLAWSLQKLYVGIPSLDALAAPFVFGSLPVYALIDARKKEVYCARYQSDGKGNMERVGPYEVLPPQRLAERVTVPTLLCGDGWIAYRDSLKRRLGDLAIEAPSPLHLIRAGFVGEIARRKFLAGEAEDPMGSVPIYVRPSEAELHYPHITPGAVDFPGEQSGP